MKSINHAKLHMLLEDNDVDDEVKLLVCQYFIKERFKLNGIVGDTIYNIIKRNTSKTQVVDSPTILSRERTTGVSKEKNEEKDLQLKKKKKRKRKRKRRKRKNRDDHQHPKQKHTKCTQ
jgi:hypothetical protein